MFFSAAEKLIEVAAGREFRRGQHCRASTGYLLVDHCDANVERPLPQPGLLARGMAMWSFPTWKLDDVRLFGSEILFDGDSARRPFLSDGERLVMRARQFSGGDFFGLSGILFRTHLGRQ